MKQFACLLWLLLSVNIISAQSSAPFADEIAFFKQQDSMQPPQANAVLFVGSSSIRLWTTLQQDFAGTTIINRGFGGATIPDVLHYAPEVIYRYKPRKIVFYCGDNDLAASDTLRAEVVTARFIRFFAVVRKTLGPVPFVFISIKPSPSRAHLISKVVAANEQIRQFLASQKKAEYVDVYNAMVDERGIPRGELFGADSLHMNSKGYEIWREKLKKAVR